MCDSHLQASHSHLYIQDFHSHLQVLPPCSSNQARRQGSAGDACAPPFKLIFSPIYITRKHSHFIRAPNSEKESCTHVTIHINKRCAQYLGIVVLEATRSSLRNPKFQNFLGHQGDCILDACA